MASVNDDLLDATIRHEIYVRRFAAGLYSRVADILDAADEVVAARIIRALEREGDGASIPKMRKVLSQVRKINADTIDEIETVLTGELAAFAASEVDFLSDTVDRTSPIRFDIERPKRDALLAAALLAPVTGPLVGEMFKKLTAGRIERVVTAVRLAVAESRPIEQVRRDLSDLAGVSQRGAEKLTDTLVAHYGNVARQAWADANDDIVDGVRWVAILDGRTSAICRSLDGKVFPVDSGPRPPAHFGCRSVVVPILKSWKGLSLDKLEEHDKLLRRPFLRDKRKLEEIPAEDRERLTGQSRLGETYQQWLARQSAKFQDETLGRTRGALFRRGKVPLDRFVDDSGRTYTLAELRQREAKAFGTANID